MVFNYVSNDLFSKVMDTAYPQAWFVRMVAQLKDNKIKTSFFDDRNTQVGFLNIPASHYKFDDCYGKEVKANKSYKRKIVSLKSSYISNANKLLGNLKLKEAKKYQNALVGFFEQTINEPRLGVRFNF